MFLYCYQNERVIKYRISGKPISDGLAAVRSSSIVNFRVRYFKLNSLGEFKVARKSTTFLTSQINVYLGCRGLIL